MAKISHGSGFQGVTFGIFFVYNIKDTYHESIVLKGQSADYYVTGRRK
jgi:hypothetical protein